MNRLQGEQKRPVEYESVHADRNQLGCVNVEGVLDRATVEYRWGSLVLTNKNQFKVDLAASYITTQ